MGVLVHLEMDIIPSKPCGKCQRNNQNLNYFFCHTVIIPSSVHNFSTIVSVLGEKRGRCTLASNISTSRYGMVLKFVSAIPLAK